MTTKFVLNVLESNERQKRQKNDVMLIMAVAQSNYQTGDGTSLSSGQSQNLGSCLIRPKLELSLA